MSHPAGPHARASSVTDPLPSSGSIPDAFRSVAAEHADRLALHETHRSLTYGEFDLASNGAAHGILALGHDRPIVLVAPVAIDSLILIYGALKVGRMVAPLDPRWPVEQWLEVARSMDGVLVVPDDDVRARLPERARTEALLVDDLLLGDASDPAIAVDPAAPAFVFFTSGSTGTPKGTVAGSGMATRTLEVFDGILVDDRLALLAPLSFISGALGAIAVLLTGASGHLFDPTRADVATLPAWLEERQITVMSLSVTVTAMLVRALLEAGKTLPTVRFVGQAGEAGSAEHFADARRAFPSATFRHGYGLTETGPVAGYQVGSAVEVPGDAVPIGRPWSSLTVEIVDDTGTPVPDGEAGEIWVTGPDVAFGYWGHTALTAERFLVRDDGQRTVRTGDRGRCRPDGMLEHLGRLDRQVKVNGQLVDLTHVESETRQLPGVRDAVVSSVPTDDGGHRVVAHVVLEDGEGIEPVTVAALRRGLGSRLPPYAIPRAFFRIDDVPQTITGKVNHAWLRESAIGALPIETEFVAPRDEHELQIARLFGQVLAIERVGVHDDFFELGGDSLAAVDLLAGLSEEFGLELSATDLLRHATVAAIAARLDEDFPARTGTVVRVNEGHGRPLFCVPGAADTPVQFRALGRRLADVAVHAFSYRGIDHRAVPDLTVAAIARRNVAAMRRVDPVGPYRLFGYSFGGAVALTMAHQLAETGAEVELLALLEPTLWSFAGSPTDEPGALQRVHERAVATAPGRDLRARLLQLDSMRGAAARFARRQARLLTAGIVVRHGLEQHEIFMRLHSWVLRTSRARLYRGRTVVLASSGYLDLVRGELDRLLPPESAGGRRTDIAVPGGHLDLVREPGVAAVARALDLLLAPGGT